MTLTIIILLVTVAMFVIGKLRADIVALCALVVMILCGILTPAEALAGFSNPVVIMIQVLILFVLSTLFGDDFCLRRSARSFSLHLP